MQNGRHSADDKLDKALEDTFPASDPVSITDPARREGEPKPDPAPRSRAAPRRRTRPDYLWLGGAFVLGCMTGLAARSVPLPKRDPAARLQRKLSALLERLQ